MHIYKKFPNNINIYFFQFTKQITLNIYRQISFC